MKPATPKEEADLLGVRFRDAVLHAFTLGKRAGETGLGASVLYNTEYEAAVKLWDEVLEFMRRQVETAKAEAKQPATTNGQVKK